MTSTVSRRTVVEPAAAFRRDGHVTPGLGLPPEQVAALRAELERLIGSGPGQHDTTYQQLSFGDDEFQPDKLTVLIDAGKLRPILRRTVTESPDIRRMAAELLGADEVSLIADEVLVKPPHDGAAVDWHQDWVVNPHLTEDYLTVWIPLQDVLTIDRGPMEFVNGSHHRGRLLPAEFAEAPVPDPRLMELEAQGMGILPRPQAGDEYEDQRTIEFLPAGVASFHHSLIWHRSHPNRSSAARFAVAQRFGRRT